MSKLPKEAKKIPDFPGYYATPNGDIWGEPKQGTYRTHHKLKPYAGTNKYPVLSLHKDKKLFTRCIHRLVLEAFIGPRPKGMECCHNNDNKLDNALKNLRWDTRSNNTKDAYKNGKLCAVGEKNSQAKLNTLQVRIIKRLLNFNTLSCKVISNYFGVSRQTISSIKFGRTWKEI